MNSMWNAAKPSGALRKIARAAAVTVALFAAGELALPTMSVQAQGNAQSREEHVKKLTGKKLKVDPTTGKPRAATAREARETVEQLNSVLAPRAAAAPVQAGSVRMVNIDGAVSRVVIARPRDNGTFETRCVTTLDEAVDFLSGELASSSEDR